ncbi:hypothetical protein ACJRO7_013239 [Eucalyptus globulus]|uniref:Uncharacterized protein n=1 Tax=Eucalyptus globulus TaxID=34317 RepID=A0ABD3L6W5_EUCGL
MGMGVSEEFRPSTPIRTIVISSGSKLSDLAPCERKQLHSSPDDEDECRTPKSCPDPMTGHTARACPPAPKKPRPPRRKATGPPPQGFFQVPHDLASVFLVIGKPSKKIRSS